MVVGLVDGAVVGLAEGGVGDWDGAVVGLVVGADVEIVGLLVGACVGAAVLHRTSGAGTHAPLALHLSTSFAALP